eukprot:5788152-Prymnesium_polylepis.1
MSAARSCQVHTPAGASSLRYCASCGLFAELETAPNDEIGYSSTRAGRAIDSHRRRKPVGVDTLCGCPICACRTAMFHTTVGR